MSGNRVIGMGDEILLRMCVCPNSTIGISVPIGYFMTKFGLFIPLAVGGLTPFVINGMMLENRTENSELLSRYKSDSIISSYCGFLIDRYGNGYFVNKFTFEPFLFYLNNLPMGPGIKFSLSSDSSSDDVNNTAIDLNDNIDDAFESVNKTTPLVSKADYRIFLIDELRQWVIACFETQRLQSFRGVIRKPGVKRILAID